MPTLYYASPLFTDAERAWNATNAAELRCALSNWVVLMPQELCADFDVGSDGKPDFGRVYKTCLDGVEAADVVLAILDGPDADSGTCFEIGFAVARDKPVIGLRTDWRPAEDGGGNCMLTRSCHAVVRSLTDAINAINRLAQ